MNHRAALALLAAACMMGSASAAEPQDAAGKSLFDGKTLSGWDGDPKFWSVQDGTITGQTTAENPTQGNTFLVWTGGEVGDFELTLEYRIQGGNSGIQYRSFRLEKGADKWRIGGYQADIDSGDTYSGILYGEQYRGVLAQRGQETKLVRQDGKFQVQVVEQFGDSKEIQSKVKKDGWNTYRVVADGFHFTHYINGVKTAEVTDADESQRREKGLLALQLHAGPPMTVQFKNIRLKPLDDDAAANGNAEASAQSERDPDAKADGRNKKIVFIAGRRSHGYGAHEHKAGCMLLAAALEESDLPVQTEVVTEGWPQDETVLDDADCIVIYADGGGGHPFNAHLVKLYELTDKGVGIVAIHYGVEVPKGPSGEAFLDWTGGYFEANWSVNPHWTADFDKLPAHPITRGVEPFQINDEWYYHMRFREGMAGVTPILTDLPPKETLSRPDGPHSGNPAVREAVAKGNPQHTAWATERKDGGRGFGFTGGHFHWNWGHDEFRQLVLNAIVWTAGAEVPENGVPSKSLTVEDLMKNQDFEVPDNFNPERIQKMLDEWNGKA
jgi:hypothetical protein